MGGGCYKKNRKEDLKEKEKGESMDGRGNERMDRINAKEERKGMEEKRRKGS